mgnify:CR=1 FL=1
MIRWGKVFLIALSSVLVLSCFGCGKKGPPFLTAYPAPPRVDTLKVTWKEGIVVLEGTVKGEVQDKEQITGCRVFSVWYAIDNAPCETCPVEMKGFQEIQGKVVDGTTFRCEIEKEKRTGIVYFQVRLLGRGGAVGPPSDRVKITELGYGRRS